MAEVTPAAPLPVLTKEAIFAHVRAYPPQAVDVPEWHGRVYVRQLTAKERDAFEASCTSFGKDGKAKPVLDYLTSVGGADPANGAVELPPELASKYSGTYAFGPRDIDRIEIAFDKGMMRFTRTGMSPRNLVHRGEHAFSPVGAPAVRVRFTVTGDAVSELSVFDPEVVLRAKRV